MVKEFKVGFWAELHDLNVPSNTEQAMINISKLQSCPSTSVDTTDN